MAKKHKHVFLSYFHGDRASISKLRDDLKNAGEEVWWDQDILPGQDWELTIEQALRESYAILICLSKKALAQVESGIYPEARTAIEAYKRYKPGSIFLIPVRLNKCDIPPIKIDGSQRLDVLQYADLFPASKRVDGLKRLIEAIRKSSNHP
ncbi:MAG TPA: toll/interleukin-1 receptor domain-containing protein [Pyrinomonadaceae bacterium]|nr:toll/interleukin-1 receptor domain-containing protein [Pyrinomonadaceae bacterium]